MMCTTLDELPVAAAPLQALAPDDRSAFSDRILTIWFVGPSCRCLELFGTVSLNCGPLRSLLCALSPRCSYCRPLSVAAPYSPPRVKEAILSGQTCILEGPKEP